MSKDKNGRENFEEHNFEVESECWFENLFRFEFYFLCGTFTKNFKLELMILALLKTEKQKQKEQNHNEKPSSEMPLQILIIQIFLRL